MSNIAVLCLTAMRKSARRPIQPMRSLILASLSLNDTASDNDIISALKDRGLDDLTTSPLGPSFWRSGRRRRTKAAG